MMKVLYILLLLICKTSAMFNLTKLVATLDKDGDGNITRSSVNNFFLNSFESNNVTDRCKFVDVMFNEFQVEAMNSSVLYDTLESDEEGLVTVTNLTDALMGSTKATSLTVTNLTAVLTSLDSYLQLIIAKPADFTRRYTFFKYALFEVLRLANDWDVDHNKIMTRNEISSGMRSLDENGDGSIRQCEYTNSMTLYRQHSVTAAKVYDVIFQKRDTNWSDVDSDFLMTMIGSKDGAVTTQQFVDYFSMQNILSAGLSASVEEPQSDGCESVLPLQRLTFLCVTSSVIAIFNRFQFC